MLWAKKCSKTSGVVFPLLGVISQYTSNESKVYAKIICNKITDDFIENGAKIALYVYSSRRELLEYPLDNLFGSSEKSHIFILFWKFYPKNIKANNTT